MIKYGVSALIGFMTSMLGFPVYTFSTHTFNLGNTLLVVGLELLWLGFCAIKDIE
jgi:hypothetical protein